MRSSGLSLALFCAAALFCGSLMAQVQNSPTTSPLPEPLWQTLLTLTDNLPEQIQTFKSTSTLQTQALQSQIELLEISNEGLESSLIASKADLAISQAAQMQLEKALEDSITSITKAQGEAKAVLFQNSILKIGLYIAVPVVVVETLIIIFQAVKK
jgi:hypothetical protein